MRGFNHPMAGINPRRRSEIKPRTKRHSNIEAVNNTETKPLRAVCFVFRARLEIICALLDLDREVLQPNSDSRSSCLNYNWYYVYLVCQDMMGLNTFSVPSEE